MFLRRALAAMMVVLFSLLTPALSGGAEPNPAVGPPPVSQATLNSPRMVDVGPERPGEVLPPTAGPPSMAAPLSSAAVNSATPSSGPTVQGMTGPERFALGNGPGEPEDTGYNNPLRYNGGYVQHHPREYLIFWGKGWNEKPGVREKLIEVYNSLNGSGYAADLSQYFDYVGNYSGDNALIASFTDARANPQGITEASIRAEISYAIQAQGWPTGNYENQYVVLAAPGSTVAGGAGYCGYHNLWGEGWSVPLTFLPWPGASPNGCNYGGAWEPWEVLQTVATHEWSETVTDPIPYAPYSGWDNTHWVDCEGECGQILQEYYGNCGQYYCIQGEEVADVCPSASGEGGIWHFRIFDDYLAASESHITCVLHDSAPGRFSVGLYAPVFDTATHSMQMRGGINPVGWHANYQFELTHGSERQITPSAPGEIVGSNTFSPVIEEARSIPLRGNTTYHVRLISASELTTPNSWNVYGLSGSFPFSADADFTTPDWRPIVTTEGATEVKAHTAQVHATVNPQGASTSYQFEYGTTTAYGASAPVPPGSAGSGAIGVPIVTALSGLEVGTTYHYRIMATSIEGTTYGSDRSFKTPDKPVVTAESASYVNTLEPTMNATINPERADTHYQFEYGTTESYGTNVPVPAEDIGSNATVTVERGLKGLKRSTLYHYRVTAENEVGVVHGADQSFTTLPPCKGPEQRCVWSLQAPPSPLPPSRFEMKSVSCASATLCVAVGKNLYNNRTFVDRWNGSTWVLVNGAVAGEMKHVACLGSGCFAVGVSGGLAQTWFIGEYPVGSGWVAGTYPTPLPSGATETVLNGVSCSGESACTAVGSYKGPEGIYHPLVERWNGTAWSLQSAPNPSEGTAQNAMLSVSCISIGCITVGEAAGKPVAETWVSGTWALSSPKLPAGATGGKLSSVSCSATSCVAVGSSSEGPGTQKPLAEVMEYLNWSLTSAPIPAESKGFVELAGVSCASEVACTAVGWYAPAVVGSQPTELKTLAERWNGSSWSIQTSVNSAQKFSALTDVSCTASSACTAIGSGAEGFFGDPETLAERWNGSGWSTQKLVNPEQPVEDEMKAVSCSTNTNSVCVAAGKNVFSETGYAELWNGKEWLAVGNVSGEARKISCIAEGCMMVGTSAGTPKIWIVIRLNEIWGVQTMTVPALPVGSTEAILDGVACSSASACTAVGSYKGSEGTYRSLVYRYDGTNWTRQAAPVPLEGTAQNAMLGVSCPTSSFCITVGEAAGKALAYTWNGGLLWTRAAVPPLPAGAKGATLVSVSCGSAKVCMAVGASNEGAGTEKAFAEQLKGGSWSIVATPAPTGAKGFVDLTDVTCLSPNACFSSGYYAPELVSGIPTSLKTLMQSWEGTEWTTLSTPNISGQAFNALAGISCSTSINCTAVGGAAPNLSRRPPVQLAMRFE